MSRKKKKGKRMFLLIVLAIIGAAGFYAYNLLFTPVKLDGKSYTYLFIEHEATVEQIADELHDGGIIPDEKSFLWLAGKMHLGDNIHPGRYRIINGMSMRQIVNLIKYNKEEKVKLAFNAQLVNLDAFFTYVTGKLSLKEADLKKYLYDDKWLKQNFGLSPESAFGAIVPGVYEVSWATDAEDLLKLVKQRYDRIWNTSRQALAKKIGFSKEEVIILASIVQSESSLKDEQEKIAGVYINRLKKNMMLQADPTLRFANNAFEAQRFWNSDKETNSPYNTYRFKGLPPGPVALVYPQAIDATLNYDRHRFIYFCAKPALNGYSDFSETYSQHERFANAYRRAMNARGISR
jgi:UPF0755 protein